MIILQPVTSERRSGSFEYRGRTFLSARIGNVYESGGQRNVCPPPVSGAIGR